MVKAKKTTGTKNVKTADAQAGKAEKLAFLCAKVADEHMAENIVTLKVTESSYLADYFIICTGNSAPHIGAISSHVVRELRTDHQIRPNAVDGDPSSQWIVIDYGSVVIHVLSPKMRELYQLESLWGDAPKVEALKLLEKKTPARKK